MLMRRLAAGVTLTFSFSLCSLTSEALNIEVLEPFARRDSREVETRCRAGFARGVAELERAREEVEGILEGVAKGVGAREERAFSGGGPIEPSMVFFVLCAADPLARTLSLAATDGGSLNLRSLAVLPVSDSEDGGRVTLGVPKMDDSRRKGILAAGAGVAPTDGRVPTRRFNC